MIYHIRFNGVDVGSAHVRRIGLFYEISCIVTVDAPNRVRLTCGNNDIDLGMCVPVNGGFGCTVRLPVKKVGDGALFFEVINDRFIPVCEDKPFAYLHKLREAKLALRGEVTGLLLKDQL